MPKLFSLFRKVGCRRFFCHVLYPILSTCRCLDLQVFSCRAYVASWKMYTEEHNWWQTIKLGKENIEITSECWRYFAEKHHMTLLFQVPERTWLPPDPFVYVTYVWALCLSKCLYCEMAHNNLSTTRAFNQQPVDYESRREANKNTMIKMIDWDLFRIGSEKRCFVHRICSKYWTHWPFWTE